MFINYSIQTTLKQSNKKQINFKNLKCQLSSPQPYINNKNVQEIRNKYKIHEKDTGSPEYQIAALSARISYMTEHVKKNPKDFSSTRGLISMVNARKRLLKYLRNEDKDRFFKICIALNIRIQQNQL
ncbi:plastidal 30S ribosomal protein S15 (nucleomorph) [Guillardia theta]|uniref:30S ribosomal protein S15 n=1 Tax=Guillardia theta TaxID=55529 RepID=Q98RM2_GUITH|nr:plastidal 30S ribosomal protein S15 [Guillardia theta]AAK39926.1 plastidal 30S ribosomal protein S15 [Guillardia theta]|mmetsp:Transcript_2820/g.9484  ORF Transcript_2820/g.9484 Transcript_2820/m.9484 type:complete len:127 (-) Transcript_2820:1314-1694(-)